MADDARVSGAPASGVRGAAARPGARGARRRGRALVLVLVAAGSAALVLAAAGVVVLVVRRARGGPAGPTLAQVLLAADDAARRGAWDEALAASERALALDAGAARALALRGQARLELGLAPEAAAEDAAAALALDPACGPAHALRARAHLRAGDLERATAALDEALARCRDDAPAVASFAQVRVAVEAERAQAQAALARAEEHLAALWPPPALVELEAAAARWPRWSPLAWARTRTLAQLGRVEEATTALAAAQAGSAPPGAEDGRLVELLPKLPPSPPGAPPARGWAPFLGGAWRQEGDELVGAGPGLGPYDLSLLVAEAPPPGARFQLRVELSLLERDRPPYAGLLLGGRGADDLLTLYVAHDPGAVRGLVAPAELERLRAEQKAWPKLLRLAQVRGDRWLHLDTQVVAFPDQGWVELAVEVTGDTLRAVVAGKPSEPLRLARPLDGRVGLARYYGSAARFRGWRLTGR